jgi:hypothetical protein
MNNQIINGHFWVEAYDIKLKQYRTFDPIFPEQDHNVKLNYKLKKIKKVYEKAPEPFMNYMVDLIRNINKVNITDPFVYRQCANNALINEMKLSSNNFKDVKIVYGSLGFLHNDKKTILYDYNYLIDELNYKHAWSLTTEQIERAWKLIENE